MGHLAVPLPRQSCETPKRPIRTGSQQFVFGLSPPGADKALEKEEEDPLVAVSMCAVNRAENRDCTESEARW